MTVTATGADKATDADAASSETLENFIFVSFIKGVVLFYDGLFRGTMIPRANRSITAICNTLRQAYIYTKIKSIAFERRLCFKNITYREVREIHEMYCK